MLVLMLPRVSSRVSGFPVASPYLWKLQNLSFLEVSKQVGMSFCVAGVALCDIPTCLITCRKFQNWRMPRTKCSLFCAHVSRLESLVFLWLRRVYGGSCKTSPSKVSKQVVTSFCVAGVALCNLFYTLSKVLLCGWRSNALHTPHFTLHTPHSTLSTPHSTLYTLHFTLYTLHFSLLTPHFTLHTPHFTLHTPHSSLHTLHSTLYTPHFTLHTSHSTLHTPHSTLSTPHSTLYTLHSSLHTPYSTL